MYKQIYKIQKKLNYLHTKNNMIKYLCDVNERQINK